MAVAPATVAEAYTATGAAWESGPHLVYDRIAVALVDESPVPLAGRRVLDVGAGTGAASRAIIARDGVPFAVDAAAEMLRVGAGRRPPAAAADARHLPFADGTFGAVVAAFSMNHVDEPADGLREAARVVEPGGVVLASSYALDDDHPVKAATRTALVEAGWAPPAWHGDLQAGPVAGLATPERALAAAHVAGLDAVATHRQVVFPELDPRQLVAWRLGIADAAWFVATLDHRGRGRLEERALEVLGDDPPTLVRRIVFLTAIVDRDAPA